MTPRCGLLGEKLGHSYSPRLHALLGDYPYELYEVAPDALDGFLKGDDFDALNVTIPYKRAVIPYCSELSARAEKIGSVNTLLRRSDGTLYGDNTDAAGFEAMLRTLSVDVSGKKAIVLGSGGASRTAQFVLRENGADVVVISRRGEDNYENIDRHRDARLIVNTTPVGMYPDTEARILDLSRFERLEGALDLIYNPARTAFLEQAEALGVPAVGGLTMLVEQARAASELFTGATIPPVVTKDVCSKLRAETMGLALIGMPGCGKSAVARALGEMMDREVLDCDEVFTARCGMSPEVFLKTRGEAGFRRIESEILRELGARPGVVLSTGGGCVTVPENRSFLRRNFVTVFLERDTALLPTDARPLSQAGPLEELYARRLPLYRRFADVSVKNDAGIEDAARRVKEAFLLETSHH